MFECDARCRDMMEAARNGHLQCLVNRHHTLMNIRTPHTDEPYVQAYMRDAMFSAGMCQNLECLQYLLDQGVRWPTYLLGCAIRCGLSPCVVFAHRHHIPWGLSDMEAALKSGNLTIMRYMFENGARWWADPMDWQFHELLERSYQRNSQDTCEAKGSTSAEGVLHCLIYAHEHGAPWTTFTDEFCMSGHLDCLEYAVTNGVILSDCSCACLGFLECLKYALEHGASLNMDCTYFAAAGHLECLMYAHDNGAHWHPDVISVAASGGHLDCLKYLDEQGAPWSLESCAADGHLHCLRYWNEHSPDWVPKWTEDMSYLAARGDHVECLLYLMERGCLMMTQTCEHFDRNKDTITLGRARLHASIYIQRTWRDYMMASTRTRRANWQD